MKVFPVKIVGDEVHLLLPPKDQLDALLATNLHCVTACRHEASEPEAAAVAATVRLVIGFVAMLSACRHDPGMS